MATYFSTSGDDMPVGFAADDMVRDYDRDGLLLNGSGNHATAAACGAMRPHQRRPLAQFPFAYLALPSVTQFRPISAEVI